MTEVKKTKSKDKQMVLLSIFAICLVVIGHCDITPDYKKLWIFKWVYSFHMPLFFFISGYLLALTTPVSRLCNLSYGSFLKKKCVRLLIPFLFFNSIIFLIKSQLHDPGIMQNPVPLNWKSFLYSTFFSPVGFLWFLPCLFTIFVIIYPLFKVLKLRVENGMKYLIGLAAAILIFIILDLTMPEFNFMQLYQSFYYATFFLLGILYFEYKEPVDRFIKKYWLIAGIVFFSASASLYFSGYLASFFGVAFSVIFALILQDKCPDKFVKFSGLTYVVFLLSYFPQMMIRGPIAHRFPNVNQYIFSGISFIVGLFIPLAIGLIVLRYKNSNRVIKKFAILIGL